MRRCGLTIKKLTLHGQSANDLYNIIPDQFVEKLGRTEHTINTQMKSVSLPTLFVCFGVFLQKVLCRCQLLNCILGQQCILGIKNICILHLTGRTSPESRRAIKYDLTTE